MLMLLQSLTYIGEEKAHICLAMLLLWEGLDPVQKRWLS